MGWDERFLTYANTDLQLFNVFIAIFCLNGAEQPFKGHQCPFFLPLRRRDPRLRRGSFRPRGGRRTQRPPPPGSAPASSFELGTATHCKCIWSAKFWGDASAEWRASKHQPSELIVLNTGCWLALFMKRPASFMKHEGRFYLKEITHLRNFYRKHCQ